MANITLIIVTRINCYKYLASYDEGYYSILNSVLHSVASKARTRERTDKIVPCYSSCSLRIIILYLDITYISTLRIVKFYAKQQRQSEYELLLSVVREFRFVRFEERSIGSLQTKNKNAGR